MKRCVHAAFLTMALCAIVGSAAPCCFATDVVPYPDGRFVHSGNGELALVSRKSGARFNGSYRFPDGTYDAAAYKTICRVFGAPCTQDDRLISLRLIEFIDAIQDRFDPDAEITITSGYRSPQYNQGLRQKGALAAKASLHQYGMAADLIIHGVPSSRVWAHVKEIGFGGAGYYHGETVHIDVGPARWWDETSSGVGTGISDANKLIGVVTDFDIYRAGDPIILSMIRMTAFPIGMRSTLTLERVEDGAPQSDVGRFIPRFAIPAHPECTRFGNIAQMGGIRWRLPGSLSRGRYRIRVNFCQNAYRDMPPSVVTPVFWVGRPLGVQH